jgi:hypothetical protein
MRDFEKEIAAWRKTMARASGHNHEMLDELEAHLRDEIERLVCGGTTEDKVFQIALANLGSPSAVGAEFQKLADATRPKWKPVTIAQVVFVIVAVLCAGTLLPRIGHERMTILLASHILAATVGYVSMFIMGALGICYVLASWFQQIGRAQRYALRRASFQFATLAFTLTALAVVLGIFWAKENLGRFWAWDVKETGALFVLGSAIIMVGLCWLKGTSPNTIACMSIIGNVSTAWAWFGSVSGGFTPGPHLLVFAASQFVVLLGAAAFAIKNKTGAECDRL